MTGQRDCPGCGRTQRMGWPPSHVAHCPVSPEPLQVTAGLLAYNRGLNDALTAVRALNGDGFHEPSDDALNAAERAIQRLVLAALAAPPATQPDAKERR